MGDVLLISFLSGLFELEKMFENKKKTKVALKADAASRERLLLKGNVDTKAVG